MNKFACTKCQQTIGYSEKHAGKVVKCPKCKTTVQLPLPTPANDPFAIDPFDDMQGQAVQPTNMPKYAHSKKRRRSAKKNWLKWGLISGLLGLLAIAVVAVALFLVFSILSPTPESVFRQWRQAMKDDDYGALYDLLCEEEKAKLDPVIRTAARRELSKPEEVSDLSGRALFHKLAARRNLVITNRPDLIVRTRSIMYGTVEMTGTEIDEDEQRAYVEFEFGNDFKQNAPSNIKAKRIFLSSPSGVFFNYLELKKEDGRWKLANSRIISLVLK